MKQALIIGGTKGLGKFLADGFFENEHTITVIGRTINKSAPYHSIATDLTHRNCHLEILKQVEGKKYRLLIHCASAWGESVMPNQDSLHNFFNISLFSFSSILSTLIKSKHLTHDAKVITIGSTAVYRSKEHFNPCYVLAKQALQSFTKILQDLYKNTDYKFSHIVLGSLAENKISYNDVFNTILYLDSLSKNCYPTEIVLKSENEL